VLEYFKGAPKSYTEKYGPNIGINCNGPPSGCGKQGIKEGYNCPKCEFDMCMECHPKALLKIRL
jgi:hypothetical protein